MKPILSITLLAVVLLTACSPAANRTLANNTDDLIRLYGDDVVRTVAQNADNASQQVAQNSDEVAIYWDDILRQTSQTVRTVPSTLIYKNSSRLSAVQKDTLEILQTELSLSLEDASLYLQGMCNIANWASIFGTYPSDDFTHNYVLGVAEENGLTIDHPVEFSQSIRTFSTTLIEDRQFVSRQEAAKQIFDVLCVLAG